MSNDLLINFMQALRDGGTAAWQRHQAARAMQEGIVERGPYS
ncbi:MAG: hypothetical protein ABI557_16975 [Aureliella sp.]